MSTGDYQYETLDLASHTQVWNDAKNRNTWEYGNAIKAPEMIFNDYHLLERCLLMKLISNM